MTKPTASTTAASTSNRTGLRIKTKVRAGGIDINHGLRIKTKVRAGGIDINHGLRLRSLTVA